jgi:RNA polymerase subunit RPABC4/transcription elongation factor Spt4
MNESKSQFRREVAIIPRVAWAIAVLAFAIVQVCLLGLLPHYEKDIPPMAALVPISICSGIVIGIIVLMIGYVNADSKRRGMNSLLWTLLVIFVPKALGFLAYFLLRKPLLMPCPKCSTAIGSDFRYCPKCGYALAPSCSNCGRAIQGDFVCCPYCGKPAVSAVGRQGNAPGSLSTT